MPIIRPNADIQADWFEAPSGSAFDRLDDAVEQPAGVGVGDYIQSTLTGEVCIVGLETLSLGNGDTVEAGTLWANGLSPDVTSTVTVTLEKADGTDLATLTFNNETQQWKSAAFTAALTAAEVDGLQIRSDSTGAGVSARKVFATYVNLTVKSGRRTRSMMGVGA